MKKFELLDEDINNYINSMVKSNPDSYVPWEKWGEEIKARLDIINRILDKKYNRPREKGKNEQSYFAYTLNRRRKEKTFEIIKQFYHNCIENNQQKITLVTIAKITKLNINTIRSFLEEYNTQLKLGHTSIAKNVKDILTQTFTQIEL